MSQFPWYAEIEKSDEITQGDLILDCLIPLPNANVYESVLAGNEIAEESLEVISAPVAVLSQACDIVQEKISSIIVCPTWTLQELAQANTYYSDKRGRESLRQGKEPAYHLLNSYDATRISMDFSVVDFHRIYSLPKEYLRRVAGNAAVRLRLLPPYREHLSQAFARYFMRVGLPLDIDRKSIEQYEI